MNLTHRTQRILTVVAVVGLASILCLAMFNLGRVYEVHLNEYLSIDKLEPHGTIYVYKRSYREFHDSELHLVWSHSNVITLVGRNASCDYLFNQTFVNGAGTAFYYIAIGTGSGGGASSTALVSEFTRATATYAGVAGVTYNCTLTKTWAAGTFSGQTITEAGVLNAASSGTLWNYQDFTGITLQSGDSLQVTFQFQMGG
jgi:hypothetical protein